MNITNRLYTYPILSYEKDDYKNSVFEVHMSYKMKGVSSLLLEFGISMNNNNILKLISDGKAEYVIHIECPTTTFRVSKFSTVKTFDYEIPISRINGKIEIVALIISKKNINNFKSDDWVDDFKGLDFNLDKGSIIGYENLPSIDITKQYEEFANVNSIFLIYKRYTISQNPMDVGLDSSKIRIGLCSEDYNLYLKFRNKIECQSILNAMIILPSLVYVFEELSIEGGIETFEDREWFKSLEIAYKKRGINLYDEINDDSKSSVRLAQEVMDLPINSALSNMAYLYDDVGEGEE